jgi:hypothetical protein
MVQAERAALRAPRGTGRDQRGPCDGDLQRIWCELEAVRAAYARALPKPVDLLARLRAALCAIDPAPLLTQHPHARGIIDCALFELRGWETTWPQVPGRSLAPSSFGALALVYDTPLV